MNKQVPILTYHSLDDSESVLSTAPEVFREQMQLLQEWGYHGLCLSELLDQWEAGKVLEEKSVVITFDDAFENFADVAAPVLADVGFRATIFAVAGYGGSTNDWPGQPADVPRLATMSNSQLRGLGEEGFEIGAHTVTHPRLPQLPLTEAEEEIVQSKVMLEDRLGRQVNVFAYPYGLADHSHLDMVKRHYRGACGVAMRHAKKGDDRFNLPRIDMYYFRRMSIFRHFGRRECNLYIDARAFLRRVKAFFPH